VSDRDLDAALDAEFGVGGGEFGEDGFRAVGGAVVHDEDLVGAVAVEVTTQIGHGVADGVLLVVAGNDHAHAGSRRLAVHGSLRRFLPGNRNGRT